MDCGRDERGGSQEALKEFSVDLWGTFTHKHRHAHTHKVNVYVNERLSSGSGAQIELIVSIRLHWL